MGRPPGSAPVEATEASAQAAAERAINDPKKLARAARQFRAALARGLVTPDGHLVEADDD